MSNKRISDLPAAASVSEADLLPVSQGSTGPNTGTTRKATLEQVVNIPQSGENLTAAGTTQGTAAAITTNYVNVTAAVGQYSVVLPAATIGQRKVVGVDPASPLGISMFPAVGEEFYTLGGGSLGVNTPILFGSSEAYTLDCLSAGRWIAVQIA